MREMARRRTVSTAREQWKKTARVRPVRPASVGNSVHACNPAVPTFPPVSCRISRPTNTTPASARRWMARGGSSSWPKSLTPAATKMRAPSGARFRTSWQVVADTASHVCWPPPSLARPFQCLHDAAARFRVRVHVILPMISSTKLSHRSATSRTIRTVGDGRQ